MLDRYRLERRLGAGAFGTVWLARDERLEREVAVKILPRERVSGGRFEREARAAARLAHPGIVTLYEASVDDEGAYLVSELVRGKTLDAVLEAGCLSDQDIVAIGIALCDALDHAHVEGVVHRDIKPSNVLVPDRPVTPAQVAKLTDFGVARVMDGDSLTMTGDVIGTLAYMAPEQAEGREAGPEADLYSLALVLYEALTGINPVRVGTAARRARRLTVHLPPLRRQRRDLPRALGTGIDLAVRPLPRERGRLSDLRQALAQAHELVGDEPGVVGAPWSSREDDEPYPDEASVLADRGLERRAASPAGRPEEDGEDALEPPAWIARGLGAAGAAASTAWLSAHVLAPSPAPPALAALLAAALVLLLPRLGWLALICGLGAGALAQGHAGLGLLTVLALLAPVLLLPLRPTVWPLAIAAPALGVVGLAGAWPALAGQARGPWRRAALGAAGWLWLLLLTPLAGRTLFLAPLAGVLPTAAWQGSVPGAARTVLGPLLASGVLGPALVWAAAAALVPVLIRGRSLALDLIRTTVWAAVLVSATPAAIVAGRGGPGVPAIHGAALGGVLAALVALVVRWSPQVSPRWSPWRRATGSGARFP